MHYHGSYSERAGAIHAPGMLQTAPLPMLGRHPAAPSWACSLFAALGDPQGMLYGRNFDWEFSPALLLLSDPPEGDASFAMVDLSYLDIDPALIDHLDQVDLESRRPLLDAPYLPFDGMNEAGLAVGMAAVPALIQSLRESTYWQTSATITTVLQKITGESILQNADTWQKWWNQNRDKVIKEK